MKGGVSALQSLTEDGQDKFSRLENHIKESYRGLKEKEGIYKIIQILEMFYFWFHS